MNLLKVLFALLVSTAVALLFGCNRSQTVKPLSVEAYAKLKDLINTPGTDLATVVIEGDNGHYLKGTLVRKGGFELIVTAAHIFRENEPDTAYRYILDGEYHPISAVYSHPYQGSLGMKDIAFCVPGEKKTIHNFWKASVEERRTNLELCDVRPFKVMRLEGQTTLDVKSALSYDNVYQLYIVNTTAHDGDSGSGLIGDGRLFVIKGYASSSSFDLSKLSAGGPYDLALITEL